MPHDPRIHEARAAREADARASDKLTAWPRSKRAPIAPVVEYPDGVTVTNPQEYYSELPDAAGLRGERQLTDAVGRLPHGRLTTLAGRLIPRVTIERDERFLAGSWKIRVDETQGECVRFDVVCAVQLAFWELRCVNKPAHPLINMLGESEPVLLAWHF